MTRNGRRERNCERPNYISKQAMLPVRVVFLKGLSRRPSRNELERWVRSPEQPRRTFARWYLARFEIRAGRRERARQLFTDLRRTGANSPATARALLEF